MKKLLLISIIGFLPLTSFCQVKTLLFDYIGPDIPPPCNVFKDQPSNFWDEWKVSHGTPSSGDVFGQNTYSVANLAAKWTGSDPEKSEGLFINYNFQMSHTYDITISVSQNSGSSVGIDVFAATGVTESTNTTCTEDAIPTVSAKRSIYSDQGVYDGPTGNFDAVEVTNWSPRANYSQIWVVSRQFNYSTAGSLYIDQIVIWDNGELQDNQPPTTPTNLTATSINPSGFTLHWTASTDNNILIGYKIFKNGQEVGSTSGTSYSFNNLASCSHNDIAVMAYDSRSNFSDPAEISVNVPTNEPEYRYLDDDLSANTSATYYATIFTRLIDGFKYLATAQTPGLKVKTLACETYDPNGRISLYSDSTADKVAETQTTTHTIYSLSEGFRGMLYPNPVDDEFKVSVPDDELFDITISSSSGQILRKLYNQNKESAINVATLPQGLYVVEIKAGNKRIIDKIIKR